DTVAATMPDQIDRAISKKRVKIVTDLANTNLKNYIATQIGKTTSVLVENDNMGRTPDDISVKICNKQVEPKTICDVKLAGVTDLIFTGQV
ncbi:MAG: hypothetical protein MJ152_04240, partial [Clostridia bacterium]|nr:hypothetical protein [Clostridia bacterium]